MFRRFLLTLTIICGLLAAPLAMASERAAAEQATAHCAQSGKDSSDHAPVKQFRCMGACFGVEANVTRLAPRIAPAPRPVAIAATPALRNRVIAHDPPPPRA